MKHMHLRNTHRLREQARAMLTGSQRQRLEQIVPQMLWLRLEKLGLSASGPRSDSCDALRTDLGIQDRYARWLEEALRLLQAHGLLERDARGWVPGPKAGLIGPADIIQGWSALKQELEAIPDWLPRVRLADVCLDALPGILRGEIRATEIIFPRSSLALVEGCYRDNALSDYHNQVVAQGVAAAVEQRLLESPDQVVRIVEIGAGTGGTSSAVLAALKPWADHVEYLYTDVSAAFLINAEQQFKRDYPFLQFKRWNIEEPADASGIELGHYDMAIATNVLHATHDIRKTLRHVKTALCVNGLLIINEITQNSAFGTVTFGLLDGWWLYDDPDVRIAGTPLLSTRTWEQLLAAEGFRHARCVAPLGDEAEQHVIAAESDGMMRLLRPSPIEIERNARDQRSAMATSSGVTPVPAHRSAPADVDFTSSGLARDLTPAKQGEQQAHAERMATVICRQLCKSLRLLSSDIDLDVPFSTYGVDSILGAAVVAGIGEEIGIDLNPAVLFEFATVERLAQYIAGRYGAGLGRPAALPASPAKPSFETSQPVVRTASQTASGAGRCQEEIAVIGMAGQFPGATDIGSFWNNLVEGRMTIGTLSGRHLERAPDYEGQDYRWGGSLADGDVFDPLFFNISPREAASMNPHQRLVLQESWRSIEDAAIDPRELKDSLVGMFIGAEPTGYSHQSFTGFSDAIIAARLAYLLDLHGPALVVNTGCSSSAVALHLACQSLLGHESDIAIAGGVCAGLDQVALGRLSEIDMLSPTGACRTFDADADGTVMSEGVAIFTLKRLSDALDNGDPIYGVIQASGMNQDGAKNGITAPNGSAQQRLVTDLYQRHGIAPEEISHIEAHGTGTRLGDPVEANALARALGAGSSERPCLIGSAKSFIGHTGAASGAVGLLKLMLSLQRQRIPGQVGFNKLNPLIRLEGSRLRIATETTPWVAAPGTVRRAALNSFGHSGTNVHIVVREHVDAPRAADENNGPALVPMSARTSEQLRATVRRLLDHLQAHAGQDLRLEDIACTLQQGRDAKTERIAFLADSTKMLMHQLGEHLQNTDPDQVWSGSAKQGTALVRLLSADQDMQSAVQAWLAQGKLAKVAQLWVQGFPVQWATPAGDARRLHLPTYPFERQRYWKPLHAEVPAPPVRATGAVGIQVRRDDFFVRDHVVLGKPIVPAALIIELARRGAGSGTGPSPRATYPVSIRHLTWGTPLHVLGNTDIFVRMLEQAGAREFVVASRLNEQEIVHAQGQYVDPAETPFDITGAGYAPENLESVDIAEFYRSIEQMGVALGSSMRGISALTRSHDTVTAEVHIPDSAQDARFDLHPAALDSALQSAALLFGMPHDRPQPAVPFAVDALDILAPIGSRFTVRARLARDTGAPHSARKVNIDLVDSAGNLMMSLRGLSVRTMADRPVADGKTRQQPASTQAWLKPSVNLMQPIWLPAEVAPVARPEAGVGSARTPAGQTILINGSQTELEEIKKLFPDAKWINLNLDQDVETISAHLTPFGAIGHLIWIPPRLAEDERSVSSPTDMVVHGFRLIKALMAVGADQRALEWSIITRQSQGMHEADAPDPLHAGLHGLVGSAAKEFEHWAIRLVDLGLDDTGCLAQALALAPDPQGDAWAHRHGRWYRQSLVPLAHELPNPASASIIVQHGVYVVLGGAGGIGQAWTEHVARTCQANVVWLGRRHEDETIRNAQAAIARIGPAPAYMQVDASDTDALRATLDQVMARYGRIDGIVHSAITLDDQSLARMQEQQLRRALASKIGICTALGDAIKGLDVRLVLFFSSVQSVIKAPGQGNYAAGCTFVDAFAHALGGQGKCRVKLMQWGYWGSVGIVSGDLVRQRMRDGGMDSLEPDEGMRALDALLNLPVRALAVLKPVAAWSAPFIHPGYQSVMATPVLPETIPAIASALQRSATLTSPPAGDLKMAESEPLLIEFIRAHLHAVGIETPTPAWRGAFSEAIAPRLHRWMQASCDLLARTSAHATAGPVQSLSSLWDQWKLASAVWSDNPHRRAQVVLVEAALENLPRILRGQVLATDVLFPDGSLELVENVYRHNRDAAYFNARLADALLAHIDSRLDGAGKAVGQGASLGLRILELGAGTGGTSAVLLDRLSAYRTHVAEYVYSDVSRAFLQDARARYASTHPFVEYRLLDAGQPLLEQGLRAAEFDIVVAANVLHITLDILNTLRCIKPVIKTNGLLLLNEITDFSVYGHLTFGLLDGWWTYADSAVRVPGTPALSPHAWNVVLSEAGFRDALFPAAAFHEVGLQTIVASSDGILLRQASSKVTDLAAPHEAIPPNQEMNPMNLSAPDQLLGWLQQKVADAVGMNIEQVDVALPMENFGLDSILVIRLTKQLRAILPDLTTTAFFEHPTVTALANHLGQAYPQDIQRLIGAEPVTARQTVIQKDTPVASEIRSSSADGDIREQKTARQDVAVIGIAGKFPLADDVAALWQNLRAGRSCIRPIPDDRWDAARFAGSDENPMPMPRFGGFMDRIDEFDPLFFRISPAEALAMDPQERMFLQSAWHAIEDAGHTPANLCRGGKVGVFVGVMNESYFVGAKHWSIANRVSYHLDLHGPSLAVDTACSSSLTAIHLALESLQSGSSQCAIAGGVNLIMDGMHLNGLAKMRVLAEDGRNKAFAADADGFVDGEAVAAVVLKPLAQALADGDRIYGVIRGSAINSGGKTSGYTVPNPAAQSAVISEALARSQVRASELSYLEAHGTGTVLGDPIEIAALTRSFREFTEARQFCALGSLKTNIGHTESAAGVVGLIKVLLQLQHRELVPTLHAEIPNPEIDFAHSPFRLQHLRSAWIVPAGQSARMAGLSSFGAGGANAHLIVEEFVEQSNRFDDSPHQDQPVLIVLSAQSPEALQQQAGMLLAWARSVAAQGRLVLSDLAHTLQIGRVAMDERMAFVVRSEAELIAGLAAGANEAPAAGLELFRDQAHRHRIRTEQLRTDPAMQTRVKRWISLSAWQALAQLWVTGFELDWSSHWSSNTLHSRRLALPLYPFAKERYWQPSLGIPAPSELPAAVPDDLIHPLLHRNISNLDGIGFSTALRGDEFFLTDHRVRGRPTLPGVAYLEMALAAFKAASPAQRSDSVIHLGSIVWVQPLVVESATTAEILLARQPDSAAARVHFEVLTRRVGTGQPVVKHCQGQAWFAPSGPDPITQLDLTGIEQRCQVTTLSGASCIERFARAGVHYGPAHQALEYVRLGHDEALAALSLPGCVSGTAGAYSLHPGILDGAFQACVAFWPDAGEDRASAQPAPLPFGVEEIVVLHPAELVRWAHLRRCQAGSSTSMDIDLADASGRICVRMHRISSRATAPGESERQILADLPVTLAAARAEARHQAESLDQALALLLWNVLRDRGGFQRPDTISGHATSARLPARFMRWLEESARWLSQFGFLEQQGGQCVPTPKGTAADISVDAALRAWHGGKAAWTGSRLRTAQVALLDLCLPRLSNILAGDVPATDVLFPSSSLQWVEPIYKGHSVADYFNHVLAQELSVEVRARIAQDPGVRLRILEIGAGTGGTSAAVFAALSEHAANIAEYRYTDLSHAFLLHATNVYSTVAPYLQTQILNIEKSIDQQGITEASYDIVIAANVLHATARMDNTLRNVAAALRDKGLLLLNELSGNALFAHLSFGLLDGWWKYDDPHLRLTGSPGLSSDTWKKVLQDASFGTIGYPALNAHDLGQQIILARRLDRLPLLLSPALSDQPVVTAQMLDYHVRSMIRDGVAKALRLDPARIANDRSFSEYGVDSLIAVNLVNLINKQSGLSLQTTIVFDFSTVDTLVKHLCAGFGTELIGHIRKGMLATAGASPAPAASVNQRKKKIMAVNASARSKAHSRTMLMLDRLVIGMRATGAEVEVINLRDLNMRFHDGSLGEPPAHPALAPDDITPDLVARYLSADLVLLATPVFFHGPSAMLKTFIERMLLAYERQTAQRLPEVAFLAVGGDPKPTAFDAFSEYVSYLFGPPSAEIYRNNSTLLMHPACKKNVTDILDATELAGREIASMGRVSAVTLSRIAQPMHDDPSIIENVARAHELLFPDHSQMIEEVTSQRVHGFAEIATGARPQLKVMVVNASARPKGQSSTEILLDAMIAGLEHGGAQVLKIDLRDTKVNYCTACFACFIGSKKSCVIRDEMTKTVLPSWLDADLVILGTPIYHYGTSAMLQTFIERTLPLYPSFDAAGESPQQKLAQIAFVGVAGSTDAHAFDAIKRYVRHIFGQPVAEIYRSGSALLTDPTQRDGATKILAAAHAAGRELAQSMSVSSATLAMLMTAAKPLPESGMRRLHFPGHAVGIPTRTALVDAPVTESASALHAKPDHPQQRSTAAQDIAIVGMSGRFAQSADLDALWAHLVQGHDLVERVTRWDMDQAYDAAGIPRERRAYHGSLLENIDQFDPLFFKISGSEADYMDPQQRLFLEHAWLALENAGYGGSAMPSARCGVFVGCSMGDYLDLCGRNRPPQSFWGNANSVVPARIAYFLDLHGPAVAVDTACSSSLVSIHMACQSLRSGETDMALSGGVFVQSTPLLYLTASNADMLSRSGRCHTFDAGADGFVIGEGVGVIVLKRLDDAVAQGDHIYGVICGSGINQDGTTNGITAPSAHAQERLIADVHARFGIDPADISLVEAHGTGTHLGDPIEFSALTRAFRQGTDQQRYCALGSIKTNVGHTGAAAGVTGVLKILLALQHGQIPPSLHFQRGNPAIDFAASPFVVNDKLQAWTGRADRPRMAAVSSFGFSGTNAHIVIREAPAIAARHSLVPGVLITLSARTENQLRQQVQQLHDYCRDEADIALHDVAFTLLTGRRHLKHRWTCVVQTRSELLQWMGLWLSGAAALQVKTAVVREEAQTEQVALMRFGLECIEACREAKLVEERLEKLSAIAALHLQGYALPVERMFAPTSVRRIPLPAYPFARERHWLDEHGPDTGTDNQAAQGINAQAEGARSPSGRSDAKPDRPEIQTHLLQPRWNILATPIAAQSAQARWPKSGQRILIAAAPAADYQAIAREYPDAEIIVLTESKDSNPASQRVISGAIFDHIFWITSRQPLVAGTENDPAYAGDHALLPGFGLIKRLLDTEHGARSLGFTVITSGAWRIHSDDQPDPAQAAVHGLVGSLAKEYENWQVRLIDRDAAGDCPVSEIVQQGAQERGNGVAWRQGKWHAQKLAEIAFDSTPTSVIRQGCLAVIIGGAGGIGSVFSEHLIRQHQARVVWIGRRPLDQDIAARIAALSVYGIAPDYISADGSDLQSLSAARDQIMARYGRIDAIVHSSLVLQDKSLAQMDRDKLQASLSAKLQTSLNMLRVFDLQKLDFVLFFSSMNAFVRAPGQSNYAAGCTFTDSLAQWLDLVMPGRVKVMNWAYWGSVGAVAGPAYRRRMEQAGMASIEPPEAMRAIEQLLGSQTLQFAFMKSTRALNLPELERAASSQSAFDRPLDTPTSESMIASTSTLAHLQLPSPAPDLDSAGMGGGQPANPINLAMARLLRAQLACAGMDGPEAPAARSLRPAHRRWLQESRSILDQATEFDTGSPASQTPQDGWRRWQQDTALLRQDAGRAAAMTLVEAMMQALPDLLHDKVRATDIMFPQGSTSMVSGVYADNRIADYFNQALTETVLMHVQQVLQRQPGKPIRILEAGAGTGATTRVLLQKLATLGDGVAEYWYTDISPAFLEHGEQLFRDSQPALRLTTFDMQRPPGEQHIPLAHFDVVIAANAVHATADVRQALRHLKCSLKPGGLLALAEISGHSLFNHLTFGLLDAWWDYSDPELRMPGCPGLSAEKWRDVLSDEGLRDVMFPANAAHHLGQQIVVAYSDGQSLRIDAPAARSLQSTKPAVAEQDQACPTQRMQRIIIAHLSSILKVDVDAIDPDDAFADYGIDSISSVRLVQSLNQALQINLRATRIFDHASVNRLAQHIETSFGDELDRWRNRGAETLAPLPAVLAQTADGKDVSAALREPVAIIGMSGRFAECDTLPALWQALAHGHDLIQPVTRWGDALTSSLASSRTQAYGGMLHDIDCFDPQFFGISGLEARYMDPQHRQFLQEAWHALEDAGYAGEALSGQHVGVYTGCHSGDYRLLVAPDAPAQAMWGNAGAVIPSRIAYHLNLHGPALAIDTACSSSLVAVHLACQGLWMKETDVALAGGVSIQSTSLFYQTALQAKMLSSNGRCRAFDHAADGFVPGEGVGVVVLKRLSDAVRDGDHIHGVILGVGTNQDGATNGITAPSALAQEDVMRRTCAAFDIDPGSVTLIEAHGTGTPLGDPIEFEALQNIYGINASSPCAVGSVKSNIGHTLAAAGIAGLIKVLLAMSHKKIPASLHVTQVNRQIDLAGSRLFIPRATQGWPVADGQHRRAAVSSMGFSGTNAHLIVEEPPSWAAPTHFEPAWLIPLSAQSPGQLRQLAQAFVDHCTDHIELDMDRVSHTLCMGRKHLAQRLALIVRSRADLIEHLRAWLDAREELHSSGMLARRHLCVTQVTADDPVSTLERIHVLSAHAQAYLDGSRPSLQTQFAGRVAGRVPLPSYPFAQERYWVPSQPAAADASVPVAPSDRVARMFVQDWAPAPLPVWRGNESAFAGATIALMVSPESEALVAALRLRMPAIKFEVIQADRGKLAWTAGLLESCRGLIDLGSWKAATAELAELDDLQWVQAIQQFLTHNRQQGVRLLMVTRGLEPWNNAVPNMHGADRAGLYHMLQAEYRGLHAGHLDLDTKLGDVEAVDWILGHYADASLQHAACVRGGQRYQAALTALPATIGKTPTATAWSPEHVAWITGGTRGLGALCARHLANNWGVRKMVLAATEALPDRSAWGDRHLDVRQQARIRTVQDLEALGVSVRVVHARLDDSEAIHDLVRGVVQDLGPVGALFHCAGVADAKDPALIRKPLATIHRVMLPKVAGLHNLIACLSTQPLQHVVLFSSVTAAIPALAAGQSDYAMANTYMDYLARKRPFGLPIVSIQWPSWRDTGMGEVASAAYQASGLHALSNEEGLALLERILVERIGPVVLPAMINPGVADPARWRTIPQADVAPERGSPPTDRHDPAPLSHALQTATNAAGIEAWLKQIVADELQIAPDRLDVEQAFQSYGGDSILLAQIIKNIEKALQCARPIDPSIAFEYPTIRELGQWLGANHGHALERVTASIPSPQTIAATKPLQPASVAARTGPENSVRTVPAPARGSDSASPAFSNKRLQIAVVGLSCHFPGAANAHEFWQLLANGGQAIGPVPEARWPGASDLSAGLLDHWDGAIESSVRDYLPKDIELLDPQARMLLVQAEALLRDAGLSARSIEGKKIGVYVGGRSQHQPLSNLLAEASHPIQVVGQNYLAANLSRAFDLRGPSVVIDTACSSALVGMQMAIQSLQTEEIEAAIVGAVSRLDSDGVHQLFGKRGLLAQGNAFHLFDVRANGILPGEGAGMVMLKTLSRAIADGDRIYAVVEGLALNNDGRTAGPASPNFTARKAVMRAAQQQCGVAPERIQYVETSGSGSPVTDLLELKALREVYPKGSQAACSLGSVKPNIGHPMTAAGIASFIKVTLMLHHGKQVPFLSAQQPMDHFDPAGWGFAFCRSALEWSGLDRVAAINCFADGGTNAHVILGSWDGASMLNHVLRNAMSRPANSFWKTT